MSHGHEESNRSGIESIAAVERRDDQRLNELIYPDAKFHWPPSLPYGGTYRGREAETRQGPTWSRSWEHLQPSDFERRMDLHVVAARESEVVVLWRQSGISPAGEQFDSPVLGLYEVRDGKLARAQMFSFDPEAATAFLRRANADTTMSHSEGISRNGRLNVSMFCASLYSVEGN